MGDLEGMDHSAVLIVNPSRMSPGLNVLQGLVGGGHWGVTWKGMPPAPPFSLLLVCHGSNSPSLPHCCTVPLQPQI